MKLKKLIPILSALFFALALLPLFAFDWPQEAIMSDRFFSYFGQLRGGTLSASLVFADSSEIKAADSGRLVAVIGEYDDSCFFPSTFGNALVVARDDQLLTVYGNIDGQSLSPAIYGATHIEEGTALGTSGNSGWQQGHSSLEFQTIDTKTGSAINPRLLMPRVGAELPLALTGITLDGNGETYDLLAQRRIPAGLYRVYRRRQDVAMPYRTRVLVNGVIVDEISYDQLIQNDVRIYAIGRRNYTTEAIYPDETRQLLGEVTLAQGRNALGMTLIDMLGAETSVVYQLTVY